MGATWVSHAARRRFPASPLARLFFGHLGGPATAHSDRRPARPVGGAWRAWARSLTASPASVVCHTPRPVSRSARAWGPGPGRLRLGPRWRPDPAGRYPRRRRRRGRLGVEEGGTPACWSEPSAWKFPGEGGWSGRAISMAQVGRAPARPVPAQIIDGLGRVVGDGPDVGGLSGPAHGHVGQLSAAAVGEEVRPATVVALGAMNGCGVPVAEPVGGGFLPVRRTCRPSSVRSTSVPAGGRRRRRWPAGGDQAAVGPGGEGDDPVAGPVGPPARADHSGPGSRPVVPSRPGPAG